MKLTTKIILGIVPISLIAAQGVLVTSRRTVHRVLIAGLERTTLSDAGRVIAAMRPGLVAPEKTLLPLLQEFQTDTGARYAAALDASGVISAHTDVTQKGRPWRGPLSELARKTGRPVMVELSVRGEPRLEAAVPVWTAAPEGHDDFLLSGSAGQGRRLAGIFRASVPLTALLATEADIRRGLLKIILVAAVLGVLVMQALVRRILTPIGELRAGASRLSRGEYGGTVPVRTSDEIGELAARFNEMSAALATTTVSRRFLSDILERMLDALLVTSPSGEIRVVNRAALRMLGYAESELLGKPVAGLFPAEDHARLAPLLPGLRGGSPIRNLDISLLSKAGEPVPVLLAGSIIRGADGKVSDVIWAAMDITERKQVETFQNAQAAILKQIVAGDSSERVLERVCGMVEFQLVRTLCAVALADDGPGLALAAAPSLPPAFAESLDAVLRGPDAGPLASSAASGATELCSDVLADPRWTALRTLLLEHGLKACWSVPIPSQGGKPLGVIIVFGREARGPAPEDLDLLVNVSRLAAVAVERKRLDAALKKNAETMLQSEKLSAVGRLAAGIAHEINNPLSVILGFAQAAARRIPENDGLELPLRSIVRESLRCKAMVQDLLTFSRQGRASRAPVDLKDAVAATLRLIEAQARVRSVRVVASLEEAPRVLGDRDQLEQVIVNLCVNAIDAIPNDRPGKVTLRVRAAGSEAAPQAVLEVEDDGAGIPADIRARLFEPFFTTKEPGKGTGLGLALVHEIVARHGGTISLSSRAGEGTVFTVTLPGMKANGLPS